MHAVLRDAVNRVSDDNGDARGFAVGRKTVEQLLDAPPGQLPGSHEANDILEHALATSNPEAEPLAAVMSVFEFGLLEFKLMALALAPELDVNYQRCIGFLMDDMSRRAGTMGFYCSLLGPPPRVRVDVGYGGAMTQWLVFENRVVAGDEPLRLDPFLVQWILGMTPRLRAIPESGARFDLPHGLGLMCCNVRRSVRKPRRCWNACAIRVMLGG